MPTVRVLDIAFKVFMACMWLMLWGVSGLWCQSARNFDHLSALNFDQVSGGYCGA